MNVKNVFWGIGYSYSRGVTLENLSRLQGETKMDKCSYINWNILKRNFELFPFNNVHFRKDLLS